MTLPTVSLRTPQTKSLFNRFEIVPALNKSSLDAVFRLRHQVYCEDLGWEARRSAGLESDRYDAHSTQLLLRLRGEDRFIACVRLVRTDPANPKELLPFEEVCASALNRDLSGQVLNLRHQIAEISRLAVVSEFRRRKGEDVRPASISDGDFADQQNFSTGPRFPYLLVALYLGTVAVAHRDGIKRLFILSEPRLAHHFSKLGVEIQQIGNSIEHRGTRIPSMINVEQIVSGLRGHFVSPLFDQIVLDVETAYMKRAPDCDQCVARI